MCEISGLVKEVSGLKQGLNKRTLLFNYFQDGDMDLSHADSPASELFPSLNGRIPLHISP